MALQSFEQTVRSEQPRFAESTGPAPEASVLGIPEIATQIFSYLPTKEVQRLRSVSRHVRDLVDEPGNQVILYRLSSEPALRRLTEVYEMTFVYVSDPSTFLEHFRFFLNHRGVKANTTVNTMDLIRFARRWTSNLAINKEKTEDSDQALRRQIAEVLRLAVLLADLHMQFHLPEIAKQKKSEGDFIPFSNIEVWVRSVRRQLSRAHLTMEDEYVRWMFENIRKEQLFEPKGASWGALRRNNSRPRWPLTALVSAEDEPIEETVREKKLRGVCGTKELQEILGLGISALPNIDGLHDSALPNNSGHRLQVAYCVKTEWAYDQVLKAAEGEPMSWQTRARVIDEIFLW